MGINSANYNLEKYITKIDNTYNPKSIHLCIYKINNKPKPFIQYLLYKYNEHKLLTFPMITNIDSKIDGVINKFLTNILKNVKGVIKGYHVYNNIDHVFIKVEDDDNDNDTDVLNKNSTDSWWWVTVDEIVNLKCCMEYNIHNHINKYFLNNQWLCSLYNNDNYIIETPSVVYIGAHYNDIIFQVIFGLTKRSYWNSLGPFYSFNTFEKAIDTSVKPYSRAILPKLWKNKSLLDKNGNNKKSGIIRLVIFVGKQRVFLNAKSDKESELTDPEIKNIEKYEDSYKKRILSLRKLKDNDGTWANNYNSAMISGIPINGQKYESMAYTTSVSDKSNYLILSYSEVISKKGNMIK